MKLVRKLYKSEIAPVKVFSKSEIEEHKARIMKDYEDKRRKELIARSTPRPLMV